MTQAELDALPQKTKKDPYVVGLYLEHDFLTAYAKHTDYRVTVNGPEGAIGDHTQWDLYGEIQRDFLIAEGLKPGHELLDLGCGTGRLARKIVPYLNHSRYVGLDISAGALKCASELAFSEGWYDKNPEFTTGPIELMERKFDVIWAFSVFIHLPKELVYETVRNCRRLMHQYSRLYFSYVPEKVEERSGLKQFRHRLETYTDAVKHVGLLFETSTRWTGRQKIAVCECYSSM